MKIQKKIIGARIILRTVIKFIKRSNEEVFLITGSLYLIGKLRKQFL